MTATKTQMHVMSITAAEAADALGARIDELEYEIQDLESERSSIETNIAERNDELADVRQKLQEIEDAPGYRPDRVLRVRFRPTPEMVDIAKNVNASSPWSEWEAANRLYRDLAKKELLNRAAELIVEENAA